MTANVVEWIGRRILAFAAHRVVREIRDTTITGDDAITKAAAALGEGKE